ncbi:glycoside hydrolase family 18 protein [Massilia antarctica]|uniref:chitinase n=1 Tax=Massilia antarctica TaxID=2765360 RepID=A0AA48WAB5_9BURK|nr:glycoside hydrolase family 18 protein [Massilia antarctica]QPI48043.1 glycoside hydrolase family 18 protein [Massilia antarctica]
MSNITRTTTLACTLALAAAGASAAPAAGPVQVQVGSYYTAWSTEQGFRLKQLDQAGVAGRFTFLNYAFANLYKMPDNTYRCDSGRDIKDAADGAGMRATLDYGQHFTAAESVDGSADGPSQPLAGNFNQLRQLKAKHPKLKVMLAIGGAEWSRWFSAGAAAAPLRRALVSSCIDLYIKGDLPMLNGHGGKGAAAGLFDGFDIDWEYPGVPLMAYNTISPSDKQNFTLLLAEFRTQLDALGKKQRKKYYLTAAVNSGAKTTDATEPDKYIKSLDWINLMTYDFNGGWNKHGPTGFHSNLYPDPGSPDTDKQSVHTGVQRFLKAGVPAKKLVIGVPFYARGWSGVPPDRYGLYQSAGAPAHGFEEGTEKYATLAARKTPKFYHPVSKQLWTFERGIFWTYDDPLVIKEKAAYVRDNRLGGMMSWALDQDDAGFALSKAMLEAQ